MDENDLIKTISEPSGEGIADIYAALRFKDSCIGRGYHMRGRCSIGSGVCLECTGKRAKLRSDSMVIFQVRYSSAELID